VSSPCYKHRSSLTAYTQERLWQVAGDVCDWCKLLHAGCYLAQLMYDHCVCPHRSHLGRLKLPRRRRSLGKVDIEAFTVLGSTRELLAVTQSFQRGISSARLHCRWKHRCLAHRCGRHWLFPGWWGSSLYPRRVVSPQALCPPVSEP
jgi:hypothetical protein